MDSGLARSLSSGRALRGPGGAPRNDDGEKLAQVKWWATHPTKSCPGRLRMRTHSIAAIPADGIGPEVISSGIRVLEALAQRSGDVAFQFKTFDWGSDYYKKHGVMMPADGLAELK